MHRLAFVFALALFLPQIGSSQTRAPSLQLGKDRPLTPGITRVTLKDDAKSTVTRVTFAPGSLEHASGKSGKGEPAGKSARKQPKSRKAR